MGIGNRGRSKEKDKCDDRRGRWILNNKGDNEDCARLRIGPEYAAKDMWSDTRCDKAQNNPYSLHALCEFDQSEQQSSTEGGSNKFLIAKGC